MCKRPSRFWKDPPAKNMADAAEQAPAEPDANMTETERIEWLRARGVQVKNTPGSRRVCESRAVAGRADSAPWRGEEDIDANDQSFGNNVHVRDAAWSTLHTAGDSRKLYVATVIPVPE